MHVSWWCPEIDILHMPLGCGLRHVRLQLYEKIREGGFFRFFSTRGASEFDVAGGACEGTRPGACICVTQESAHAIPENDHCSRRPREPQFLRVVICESFNAGGGRCCALEGYR